MIGFFPQFDKLPKFRGYLNTRAIRWTTYSYITLSGMHKTLLQFIRSSAGERLHDSMASLAFLPFRLPFGFPAGALYRDLTLHESAKM